MRSPGCRRTAERLPLYAAGDLKGRPAREVAAHLRSCEGCRERAAEFGAACALLAEACEPPEFGEEFYAGIRGAVLSEIARQRSTPSKPSPLAALFPARRLAFASALALLLLVSFVTLLNPDRRARRRADSPAQRAEATTQEGRQPQKIDTTARANATPGQSPTVTATAAKRRQSASVGSRIESRTALAGFERATVRPGAVETNGREPRVAAGIPKENITAQVAAATLESVGPARPSAAAAEPASAGPKVSRIEIQTADPNIRIIWLAPARSEEPARDRDNHENGDRN